MAGSDIGGVEFDGRFFASFISSIMGRPIGISEKCA